MPAAGCCDQTRRPHAAVNTDSFQGRAGVQGRWPKRLSQRRQEGESTTSGGVPKTPSSTSWYKKHLETFLAQVEAETGVGLPEFVKAEFDAFLQCGILAHGFLRLRCADCAHEKLLAFSCKKRGFCTSCGARRMAETAAYLVDHLIPRVPVRQWVLSFPIPLRVLFAAHPELLTPVLQILHRVLSGFLIKQAGLKRTEAATGAVTLIQRFGSAANLNIHLHCLLLDGVYRITEGEPEFHAVRAPTAGELHALLTRLIKRLMRLLTRQGYLIEEEALTYLADPGPESALAPLQAAACTYRIAFGPRAGQKVLTLQTVPNRVALPTSQRCVNEQGFSLHADVRLAINQRHKLEQPARILARLDQQGKGVDEIPDPPLRCGADGHGLCEKVLQPGGDTTGTARRR